jgi:hypothetical protein
VTFFCHENLTFGSFFHALKLGDIFCGYKDDPNWLYEKNQEYELVRTYDKKKNQPTIEHMPIEARTSKSIPTWQKVVWTPFMVALDVVTSPIQGFFVDPWASKEREKEKQDKGLKRASHGYLKPTL